MKGYTIIIADSSQELRQELQAQFRPPCCVVGCGDGMELLELLGSRRPDVLVLDLMLPRLDGLSLLHCLAASGQDPGILVTTSYVSPFILQKAEKLGVSCILERPYSMEKAADRIRQLLRQRCAGDRRDRYGRISGILLELGFSAKLRGYVYLREAVLVRWGDA